MGARFLSDVARIEAAGDLGIDAVRDALLAWTRSAGALIRMDRPLRDAAGGRHFHLAAPAVGTGTIEVTFLLGRADAMTQIEVVCREHWSGTWAGTAFVGLVEHLAAELGGPVDASTPTGSVKPGRGRLLP
jgi:hypothetical protein